jgi:hypothetical protein
MCLSPSWDPRMRTGLTDDVHDLEDHAVGLPVLHHVRRLLNNVIYEL